MRGVTAALPLPLLICYNSLMEKLSTDCRGNTKSAKNTQSRLTDAKCASHNFSNQQPATSNQQPALGAFRAFNFSFNNNITFTFIPRRADGQMPLKCDNGFAVRCKFCQRQNCTECIESIIFLFTQDIFPCFLHNRRRGTRINFA